MHGRFMAHTAKCALPVLSQSTSMPAQSQVAQGSCPTGKPGEKEASSVAAAANLAAAITVTCRQITSIMKYKMQQHKNVLSFPPKSGLGLMLNYLAFDRISQRAAACRDVCSFPGSVAWRCPAWQVEQLILRTCSARFHLQYPPR